MRKQGRASDSSSGSEVSLQAAAPVAGLPPGGMLRLRATATLHLYDRPRRHAVTNGAASMLLNGTLVSRAGSALVAMAASERGIPVLVCCETYKFAERVLLDSICYNELGDPDDLIEPEPHPPLPAAGRRITDWRDIPQLKLLNLLYDVTPTKYLSVVVTEVSALLSLTVPPTRPLGSPRSPQVGIIPPTSVPVVIREDAARAQLPARA